MRNFYIVLLFTIGLVISGCSSQDKTSKNEAQGITEGSKVVMDYVLAINGKIVDSSKKSGALHYIHGGGTLIKGLESKLDGMKIGEERNIIVPARQAYGDFNKEAVKAVPRDVLPDDFKFEVGQVVQLNSKSGEKIPVRVVKIEDNQIIFDFNHPLAGQDLQYRVKIVDIQ